MLDFIDRTVVPFFLSLYDAVGYLGVAIAIGLETFVPIIPSEVIVPMAGWKVSQSAADPSVLEPLTNAPWNWLVVLVIATLGAVAGSLAGYLIGAWGGRPLLDRWGRYVHIKPDDLDRADAWFARYGDRAVFFARLVPLLRALINYPAGVARMPIGRFLFFSALGSLPWNAALLLGGYVLGENYKRLYEAVRPFELLIYVVVVLGVAYVTYRWLRGRGGSANAEAEGAAEVRRLVDALEAQVNNGGFDQLFFNSAGDEVAAMIDALEAIGATKTAEIVRRACARFPGGMPPMDRNERQTLLLDTVNPDDKEAFEPEDDDFLAYEEDLAALVADFAGRSAG